MVRYMYILLKHKLLFSSDTFKISKAEGVQPGTKVVIHLNLDCRNYSDDNTINSMRFKHFHTFIYF